MSEKSAPRAAAECPQCGSDNPVYRNPLGHVDPEDDDSEYEWCLHRWHEPFFFDPPLEGQAERERTWDEMPERAS